MKRRGYLLLCTVLGLLFAGYMLLTAERGLLWTLQLAQILVPGQLSWKAVAGQLIGPFTLRDVEYRDENAVYRLSRFTFDWSPNRLIGRTLSVALLHADNIDITLAPRDTQAAGFEPGWFLPFHLDLRDARISNLRIHNGTAAPVVIESMSIAASGAQEWIDLRTFAVRFAEGEVSGQGRFGLGRTVLNELTLDWQVTLPGYAPFIGQGRLSGTWDELQLTQVFRAPVAAQLQASVVEPFAALRWHAELTAPMNVLTLIHPDWPAQKLGGKLQASGSLTDYRLNLDARIEADNQPPAAVTAIAQGDAMGLRIENAEMRTLDGLIQAQGELAWAPHLAWEMQVNADGIDPGNYWSDWPGKLSAQVHSSGSLAEPGLTMSARIHQLDGVLRGYPVSGDMALSLENGITRIEAAQFHSGEAQLTFEGALAEQWDLRWRLQAPDGRQLVPDIAGSIDARGTLRGTREYPHLQLSGELREFTAPNLHLTSLQLAADVNMQPHTPMRLTAQGKHLDLAGHRFATFSADLNGVWERHNLTLQAQGPDHALQLRARGTGADAHWKGRIEQADWQLPALGPWQLIKPVDTRLGQARGVLEKACWRQESARLCVQADYDARERRLQAELVEWPLARLQADLPLSVQLKDSLLAAQLKARVPLQGLALADAQLQVSPGSLNWDEAGQQKQAVYGGADAQLHLDAEGARATAQLQLTGADTLHTQITLPGYRLGADTATQLLEGRLRGEMRDLSLVNGLLDGIDDLSGVVSLEATLGGTLAEPKPIGELRLTDGRLFIEPVGMHLEDGQLSLTNDPATGELHLQGNARSGPGRMHLAGHIGRAPDAVGDAALGMLHADLQLQGENVELVNLPEIRVLATPDLRCSVIGQSLTLDGKLHIPEARIEPRDLRGVKTPSRDVVRVDLPETTTPSTWRISSHVRLSLGERVSFKGYGLSGHLTGALDVVDEPGKQPRARGELELRDGVYTAYGQKLKIEQGRVLYRDSLLDNPGVDVRAVRKSDNILAGVRVLGTAQNPHAELYSQPAMPQGEVLSYLVLGRPMSDISGSEGALLAQAASSPYLGGGGLLAQTIGSRFGLDEVSFRKSDDEEEGTALTLGKYLSPRIYLNYAIGLLDAADRLQLRYKLTRHLSLQSETGVAAGADLLYVIER